MAEEVISDVHLEEKIKSAELSLDRVQTEVRGMEGSIKDLTESISEDVVMISEVDVEIQARMGDTEDMDDFDR